MNNDHLRKAQKAIIFASSELELCFSLDKEKSEALQDSIKNIKIAVCSIEQKYLIDQLAEINLTLERLETDTLKGLLNSDDSDKRILITALQNYKNRKSQAQTTEGKDKRKYLNQEIENLLRRISITRNRRN